jgi:hypothetical protein
MPHCIKRTTVLGETGHMPARDQGTPARAPVSKGSIVQPGETPFPVDGNAPEIIKGDPVEAIPRPEQEPARVVLEDLARDELIDLAVSLGAKVRANAGRQSIINSILKNDP